MKQVIVNGEALDPEEILRETAAIKSLLLDQMPEEDAVSRSIRAREWAEENLIEAALLRQAARPAAQGDPAVAVGQEAQLREEAQLRVERLLAGVTAHIKPPGRKESKTFYLRNRDRFYAPEMIRAFHIVKNIDEKQDESTARTGIEEALAQVRSGRPFQEVAAAFSDCPGNGDLGYFPRGKMVPEFDRIVFGLKVGKPSEVFRTDFGFHIALVVDKKPEGALNFEDVQEQIQAELTAELRQIAIHQYLDELRSKAHIRRESSHVHP